MSTQLQQSTPPTLLAQVKGGPQGPSGPAGSDATVVTVTSAAFSIGAQNVVLVDDDTVGMPVVITLPPVLTANRTYNVKKLGTTASVTVVGSIGENIDGAPSAVILTQYESITVATDGVEWWIL